jgi:threonine dehydrogenase-like Zn-dependent dehydrogenase
MFMKSVTVSQQIEIVDRVVPQVHAGQVLVKVKAVGLCGSDIQRIWKLRSGELIGHPTLGHEISGVVHEVGEHVSGLTVGQSVVVEPILHCNNCDHCNNGDYQFCQNGGGIGKTVDGGFAEYVLVPKQNVFPISPSIAFETATLVDGIGVGVHAINKVPFSLENTLVGIVGDGAISEILKQLCFAYNAKEVLTFGKHSLTNPNSGTISIFDKEAIESFAEKCDVVFEVVGRNNSDSLNLAIKLIRKKGAIIVLGVYQEGFYADVNVRQLFYKEAIVVGSNSYCMHHGKSEFIEAIKLLEQGKIKPDVLITHILPLEEFEKGVYFFEHKAESGARKIVFTT